MPICQQLNFEHSQFAVWKVTEKLDELIALLPDYIDISTKLNNTKNEKRKFELVCEHLLLHHLINKPFELCHKENGSPYLKNSNKYSGTSQLQLSSMKAYLITSPNPDINWRLSSVLKKFILIKTFLG